jgi:lipopolysaccharide heptosyltransferase I
MTEPRFLVVRLGSLGDIAHTFPTVSGLRTSFPNSEIIWLTHPKWEFLINTSELATRVWTVDTRNWSNVRSILARTRKHRFETAIDYQGLWKSAALPFLARIPRRIGFSSETIRESGVPILYTDRVKVSALRHVADQNAELSARAGARVSTAEVNLSIPPDDEKVVRARLAQDGTEEYMVLCPGGGWRSKCWPAERYGLLAQRVLEQLGLRSVINVGPGEEDLAAKVAAASRDAQPIQFTGSLGQLMALLKNASAVVAGDTGPLHLADALRTRVVAIFGPTDPARNGPYRRSGVVLRWEGAATSYKRKMEPDESLLHISVDEVMSAIRGLREAHE